MKPPFRLVLVLLFVWMVLFFSTQILHASSNDTNKVNEYEKQILQLRKNGQHKDVLVLADKAILFSKKTSNKHKLSELYANIAQAYSSLGLLDSALIFIDSSLLQAIANKKPKEISFRYRSMGIVYNQKGNMPKALSCFLNAHKHIEEAGDSLEIARSLVNLGLMYREVKDYNKSIANYHKGLVIQERIRDTLGLNKTYNNIGVHFDDLNEDSLALIYYKKSLHLSEIIGDKESIAKRKSNIAAILIERKLFKEAEKELLSSLAIRQELNEIKGLTSNYLVLAWLYLNMNEVTKTFKYIELAQALNYQSNEVLININQLLYQTYEKLGDYKKAFEYYKKYDEYQDSLNSQATQKSLAEISSRYQYEKTEKEIAILTREKKINKLEMDRQADRLKQFKYVIVFSVLAVAFMALSIFLIFSRYKNKKRLSLELETKNTQITRSINYAKRIQGSLLPSKYLLVDYFSESFILFKPKDIVSGDFYWIANKGDKTIVAVADCTGHGIPGAFLSMIGNTLLNEIVNQKNILSPSSILTNLNDSVVSTLMQTNVNLATQDDGMDITVCSFDKNTKELIFAGANHSLVLFKNGEHITLKGELFSIGGFSKNLSKTFTEHKISGLSEGDMIYMFTDGFYDQFGGMNRKKYMSQRFKNLLSEIYAKPNNEQKAILEKTLAEWQGNEPQTDDILVMGLRV